jgi:uncharacterized protein (DUF952 family)
MILHITSKKAWDEALKSGEYTNGLAFDGFIHCSTPEQINKVAQRLFKGARNLVILEIDPEKLQSEIKYESQAQGKESYPHIYGQLNIDAVVSVKDFYLD